MRQPQRVRRVCVKWKVHHEGGWENEEKFAIENIVDSHHYDPQHPETNHYASELMKSIPSHQIYYPDNTLYFIAPILVTHPLFIYYVIKLRFRYLFFSILSIVKICIYYYQLFKFYYFLFSTFFVDKKQKSNQN